jgi:hypothetical protein
MSGKANGPTVNRLNHSPRDRAAEIRIDRALHARGQYKKCKI